MNDKGIDSTIERQSVPPIRSQSQKKCIEKQSLMEFVYKMLKLNTGTVFTFV